jgi:hypothetical protein
MEKLEELIFGTKSDLEKNLITLNKKAKEYETQLHTLYESYKGGNNTNAAYEFYLQNYQKVKGYDDFLTQLLIKADQFKVQNDEQRQLRRKEIHHIQSIQKNSDLRLERIKSIILKDVVVTIPGDLGTDLTERIKKMETEAEEAITKGDVCAAGYLGYNIYSLKALQNKTN